MIPNSTSNLEIVLKIFTKLYWIIMTLFLIFLIEEKDSIVDFLKHAWILGANWRYSDLYKKELVKFY
jgi:hypothetical protein